MTEYEYSRAGMLRRLTELLGQGYHVEVSYDLLPMASGASVKPRMGYRLKIVG